MMGVEYNPLLMGSFLPFENPGYVPGEESTHQWASNTADIQCCVYMDVSGDRHRPSNVVDEREGQVAVETSSTASRRPTTPSIGSADDVSDDDDDVSAAGARSRSPSSDVESILDALSDSTVTYHGDFTLRRVFSLEEELVCRRAAPQKGASRAAAEQRNLTASTPAALDEQRNRRPQSSQTVWTLPLARRLASAAVGKALTSAFRRLNGIAQETTAAPDDDDDDDRCRRLAKNSVVSASATAITSREDVIECLVTSSPRADVRLVTAASGEIQAAGGQVLRLLDRIRRRPDAPTTARDDLTSADDASKRSVEPTCEIQSTTSPGSAAANGVECELPGTCCSGSEMSSGECCRPVKVKVTAGLPPVQRSSSNRDASRPPIQPSSVGRGIRRSATVADCLPGGGGGLATLGVSRSSSCEVLVDDDEDSRLCDVIGRWRGGGGHVTRRSSCASSVDSTAASETDSSSLTAAAWPFDDPNDLLANSLLDRLLTRLRSTPRDSPYSCVRRPSVQTSSVSWSSSEEDLDEVDRRRAEATGWPLPSWKHCSLLSSLDDVASDSDFELGSSLSQLVVTSGNSPRHHHSSDHDVRVAVAASCGDLSSGSQRHGYGDWLDSCVEKSRPRTAAVTRTSLGVELLNSAATTLSAPITESPPAQIHVARTSRIPKN